MDDFPLNVFRRLELDGRPIGVVRTDRGFYAVRDRCPHQGADICSGIVTGIIDASGPMQYTYSDEALVVVCPWHRWEFALEDGTSVGQVTKKRLVTYSVDVEDGQVYVSKRARREQPSGVTAPG
jgi:nitrite reductase/ring-hydroxylating ferredoxin subunit